MEMIQRIDWILLEVVAKLHHPILDVIMQGVTFLGNGGVFWILLGVILLFFKRTRKCAWTMALALFLLLIFGNGLLKPIIDRQRPFEIMTQIPLLIAPPADGGFPSGHTYIGIAAAVVLWKENRVVGLLSMILAGLIAFSRLYLMVHFPSDILGGIALGVACAMAAIWIVAGIEKRQNEKRQNSSF